MFKIESANKDSDLIRQFGATEFSNSQHNKFQLPPTHFEFPLEVKNTKRHTSFKRSENFDRCVTKQRRKRSIVKKKQNSVENKEIESPPHKKKVFFSFLFKGAESGFQFKACFFRPLLLFFPLLPSTFKKQKKRKKKKRSPWENIIQGKKTFFLLFLGGRGKTKKNTIFSLLSKCHVWFLINIIEKLFLIKNVSQQTVVLVNYFWFCNFFLESTWFLPHIFVLMSLILGCFSKNSHLWVTLWSICFSLPFNVFFFLREICLPVSF